ncbi:MAG: hypothetical protein AAFP97_10175 [Pseudomonadota bacterium]
MFSVELAWFEFDLPDHARVEATVASPNPLFPDSRVTTRWMASLDRFELGFQLSATQDLTHISRNAFDSDEPGLAAQPFNQNGIPALRFGAYDRTRSRIDWAFHLHGLTLMLDLTASGFARTLPTEAERAEHEAIIASVRRVRA